MTVLQETSQGLSLARGFLFAPNIVVALSGSSVRSEESTSVN